MEHISVGEPDISSAEASAVQAALAAGRLTQGPIALRFEAALAALLGVKSWQVVACSSGTAALHLALAVLDLGPGDEVLVPDLTYVATANAVRYVGATPVLVDVDRQTWTIDLVDASRKLTSRTRVILPVHLYGIPCDMAAVADFAERHSVSVVEDAAEALGARWDGQYCGTFGECGTFSFYANKIVTTGEGGAVVARSELVAQRLRSLRGQAQDPRHRFFHTEVGYNYRMSDLHAAIGVAQLGRLEELWSNRAAVIGAYADTLPGVESPQNVLWNYDGMPRRKAPWLYTFLVPGYMARDTLAQRLANVGIETRPAFVPLHRLPAFSVGRADVEFPIASLVGDRGLSLPTSSLMTSDMASRIARHVEDFLTLRAAL